MPADLTQIAIPQSNDQVVQELICKTQNQTTSDNSLVHYIVQNGFFFRSVPDGQKGQKL